MNTIKKADAHSVSEIGYCYMICRKLLVEISQENGELIRHLCFKVVLTISEV